MANKPKPKQKRSGLGRGMDALFTPLEETPSEFEQVEEITLEDTTQIGRASCRERV